MNKHEYRLILIPIILSFFVACTPITQHIDNRILPARLTDDAYITADGAELPLKTWQPQDPNIESIIIAIHGFNDYSNFFQQPATYFSQNNTLCYAYDQRGFGASPQRGIWAGVNTYINDLQSFISLVKTKYPGTPIYLLGESMGGAIVISTINQSDSLAIDGIILSAPAVWGRETMPWYQNLLLVSLAHSLPWLTLTGEGLDIKPSDNIEMLKALGRDPLVIKETRVDAIYGLVNLMDMALTGANQIKTNTLLLYGEKDEIIPKKPTYQFLGNLKNASLNSHKIAFYQDGYHMLLRDLKAPVIWNDILSWIKSSQHPLASKADIRAKELLKDFVAK